MSSKIKKAAQSLRNWKTWKKSTQILALLILLVSIPITTVLVRNFVLFLSEAAAVQLFYNPSQVTLPPNNTVSLMMDLQDNTSVVFAQVELTFDNSKVNLTGEITTNNPFTTVVRKTTRSEANSTGTILIALALPPQSAFPSGVIEFARIPIGSVTSQSTQTSFNLNSANTQIVDVTSGSPVEVAVNHTPLTINLNPSAATPTPTTPVATPTPTVPEGTPTPTIPPIQADVTLTSIADAYVSGNFTNFNFGGSTSLKVDNSPEILQTYLKFDLSQLANTTINSARLRLYVQDTTGAGSSNTQNVKSVSDTSWNEYSINFLNKPSTGSTLSTINGGVQGSYVEADVTSAVRSRTGQLISFALDQTGDDGIDYYSKEFNVSGSRPKLLIDTGGVTPPTPTPTTQPGVTNTPTPIPPTPTPSGQADTTLSFQPASQDTRVGQDVSLDVIINTNSNEVIGTELYINFDRTRLQALDIVPGTFFSNPRENLKNLNNTNGTISYTLHIPPDTTPVQGTGVLATLTFRALAVGTANVAFSPGTIVGAVNIGAVNALRSTSGAVINIAQAEIPGDINIYVNGICGDGVVNILDYTVLFDNFGEAPTDHPCADINEDGRVNILDYVILFENWGRTS